MIELVYRPWPWWVAGPLIGLFVPILLLLGNRLFGVSANLRHICAATLPSPTEYLRYDWKGKGGWNLAFAGGIVLGGFLAGYVFANPEPIAIAAATQADLSALGITDFEGLVPADLFAIEALSSLRGWIVLGLGGFLVGFGAAWAGGCTSGHGIAGLGDLQLPSLIAIASFFVGGIATTHLLLPLLF